MKLIKDSLTILEHNQQHWSPLWNAYADDLLKHTQQILNKKKYFNEWKPLRLYMPVSEYKGSQRFQLRYNGQKVAHIKVISDDQVVLMLSHDEVKHNQKFFNLDHIAPGNYEWKGEIAKRFRKHFKDIENTAGKSKEAFYESLILDEMELQVTDKFLGSLRNIQPIELAGKLRFQMPVPLSANQGIEI